MRILYRKGKLRVLLLLLFCMSLYSFRVLYTGRGMFGFLVWNLFLATIPYIMVVRLKRISSLWSYVLLGFWLLFLPNAPYIITDFVHLKYAVKGLFWLDVLLIYTFANTGLLLGILSTYKVYQLVKKKWNTIIARIVAFIVSLLSGFGVYLGRFLRFNSWDFFENPMFIVKRSILSFNDYRSWLMTFGLGTFLWILFLVYQSFKGETSEV